VKKFLFTLLMAALLVCFLPAQDATAHPFEADLNGSLSVDGADNLAVITDTVPEIVPLCAEQVSGIERYDKYTGEQCKATSVFNLLRDT